MHDSPQPTPSEKLKVLFLASDPFNVDRLRLDREVRAITDKIRASAHRDRIELLQEWAVRPDDLLQLLNEKRPNIVHFSGHGTEQQQLILESNTGNPQPVSRQALVRLFRAMKDDIQGVVLNACYSRPQAEAITEFIDFAVGMNAAISNAACVAFSGAFYSALGFGRDVQNAFDQAVAGIALNASPYAETAEENIPDLLVRDGVDARKIVLCRVPCQVAASSEVIGDASGARVAAPEAPTVPQPPAEHSVPHNLPFASIATLFKGREVAMHDLHQRLASGASAAITQPQAVHGLGGVGKTRLAVEYGWRCVRERLRGLVLFVRGNSTLGLDGELAALAGPELLNLPQRDGTDQPEVVRVVRALAGRKDCLLILDNVDDAAVADEVRRRILPALSGGHVLITSRLSNWSDDIRTFPIDRLSADAAVEYLLEKTERARTASDDDAKQARQVAERLDGLPIALEQAGAYIRQRRIAFAQYLDDWANARERVLGWYDASAVNYPVAVLAAWEATERHLSLGARAALRLLSFMAPDPIPTALVETQPDAVAGAMALLAAELEADTTAGAATPPAKGVSAEPPSQANEADVRGLLAELAAWSMIGLGGDDCIVHRLVQDSVRLRIPEDGQQAWATVAAILVSSFIPNDPPPQDVRSWPIWERVDTHVETVAGHADEAGVVDPTGRLLNGLGLHLESQARFTEAEPLLRRALEIDEAAYGKDHPDVARDLNNLAHLLHATNRLKEAEPLMRRALEIDEAAYGKDHPTVARDLSNLVGLLQATNRLKEAEPLMRRALEIDETAYGEDHPEVATDLNNLAQLLQATNRLEEAELLMRRALRIDQAAYETHHPDVARDLNNLAALLCNTNRLKEAEPLMRRALEIDEAAYGKDHPNVAIRLNNLARLLHDTNRLKEAEPMMRRVAAICESACGPDHPYVATALNNLAGLLQDTNRLKQAEPLCRRALEIDEASYGKDHPKVATDLNNLAQLLKATNRLKEAEPLMRRALEIDEAAYGKDHPNVAIHLSNLAQLLKATNRLKEAEPLMRRALEIDEAVSGKDNPNVAIRLNNLAQLLQDTNRLKEAEPMMADALRIFEDSLGSDHSYTQGCRASLAIIRKELADAGEPS